MSAEYNAGWTQYKVAMALEVLVDAAQSADNKSFELPKAMRRNLLEANAGLLRLMPRPDRFIVMGTGSPLRCQREFDDLDAARKRAQIMATKGCDGHDHPHVFIQAMGAGRGGWDRIRWTIEFWK